MSRLYPIKLPQGKWKSILVNCTVKDAFDDSFERWALSC